MVRKKHELKLIKKIYRKIKKLKVGKREMIDIKAGD
jgi:ribosomal protein S17